MMKKRMLGVIAVLLVCIFALSACKKEAGKPVDNAVSENTTDDSEDTDQTEDAGKYKFGFESPHAQYLKTQIFQNKKDLRFY